MATAGELVFDEQFGHLQEIVNSKGWQLRQVEPGFVVGLVARDNSQYWLQVDCTDYPTLPPAWHWSDAAMKILDQPAVTPKGAGFFHGVGVICAPWNRLAYRTFNPNGPHGDWDLANWMSNPNTGSCTTLAAMALRMFVELSSGNYHGRMG